MSFRSPCSLLVWSLHIQQTTTACSSRADSGSIEAAADSSCSSKVGCIAAVARAKAPIAIEASSSSPVFFHVLISKYVIFLHQIGCSLQVFPFTYVGLPLSPRPLCRADYLPLLERVDNRLAGWKGSLLSRGGRLVLLNSVLTSIPTYFCSAFLLPVWVSKAIDKIRRAHRNDHLGGLLRSFSQGLHGKEPQMERKRKKSSKSDDKGIDDFDDLMYELAKEGFFEFSDLPTDKPSPKFYELLDKARHAAFPHFPEHYVINGLLDYSFIFALNGEHQESAVEECLAEVEKCCDLEVLLSKRGTLADQTLCESYI
uniref:Uncharacterized protein n=1 Tax=Ananas comosus var. bracteatus TaxID=296719 RepID=A0A6V7NPF6_ANACO|nr:unnamed protein product [Ananas comosus var. bracteatus]